jgi:hypothetical protein
MNVGLLLMDLALMLGLVFLMAKMKKEGTLTAQRFSFMNAGYWSFVILSFLLSRSSIGWQDVLYTGFLALFQFMISYPLGLWFYRMIYGSKQ